MTRVERLLGALGRIAGGPTLRVWRYDGRRVTPLAGAPLPPPGEWVPPLNGEAPDPQGRALDTPEGRAWFEPVGDVQGVWLEIRGMGSPQGLPTGGGAPDPRALADLVGAVLASERETAQVAAELSERYEEIDLIYTISEILGHTIRLDEAAQRILREVSTVVRARRASLLVYDEETGVLRVAAARGMDPAVADPIEVDDPCSVAARVFRERKSIGYDPAVPGAVNPGCPAGRRYLGQAFLSVPVVYSAPGDAPRAIGVINLTDRLGEDAFTAGDRKLVTAIANQIGAAVANARLVQRDLHQQRVRQELALAHDLQMRLLPSPLVIASRADVAVRCRPAESVGGDFYNLFRLRDDRIGVMIGDVSSHGFGAALIMALAMAASGIHAEVAEAPSEVLRRLEESLADELARTEMFLTLFFGVVDPAAGRLTYASAGHAHAFVVPSGDGEAVRLPATRPPLGLGKHPGIEATHTWRRREDVLCLFTDGLADALSEAGARYSEARVLGHVLGLRRRPAREILEAVYADLAAFTGGAPASDDRTVVLLRV